MYGVRDFTIRPLGPDDAEEFLRVHYESVHKFASSDYTPDILSAWSGPADKDRLQKYYEAAKEEIRIGAFHGEKMAGLACLAPLNSELRACYVNPEFGRQGVGALLVQSLEQIAYGMGLTELNLDSSINAERFYSMQGYDSIERTTHTLGNAQAIACIKMKKILPSQGSITSILERNKKSQSDVIWETSLTRRVLITLMIYIVAGFYLGFLGIDHNFSHALVPTGGYLAIIFALPHLRQFWISKFRKNKGHTS